jgi:sensor domain CHASE-containing protein
MTRNREEKKYKLRALIEEKLNAIRARLEYAPRK